MPEDRHSPCPSFPISPDVNQGPKAIPNGCAQTTHQATACAPSKTSKAARARQKGFTAALAQVSTPKGHRRPRRATQHAGRYRVQLRATVTLDMLPRWQPGPEWNPEWLRANDPPRLSQRPVPHQKPQKPHGLCRRLQSGPSTGFHTQGAQAASSCDTACWIPSCHVYESSRTMRTTRPAPQTCGRDLKLRT